MNEDQNVTAPPGPRDATGTVNRSMVFLAALTVAVVIFFASFYPQPLFLPTVSSLLSISATGAATLALLHRQRPAASQFTLWDVAAVLMFVALGAGILVDPAEVEAYLQTINATESAPVAVDQQPEPASAPQPVR